MIAINIAQIVFGNPYSTYSYHMDNITPMLLSFIWACCDHDHADFGSSMHFLRHHRDKVPSERCFTRRPEDLLQVGLETRVQLLKTLMTSSYLGLNIS